MKRFELSWRLPKGQTVDGVQQVSLSLNAFDAGMEAIGHDLFAALKQAGRENVTGQVIHEEGRPL